MSDLRDQRLAPSKGEWDFYHIGTYDLIQKNACEFIETAALYKLDIKAGKDMVDWQELKGMLDTWDEFDTTDPAIGKVPWLLTVEEDFEMACKRSIKDIWLAPQISSGSTNGKQPWSGASDFVVYLDVTNCCKLLQCN